LLLLLLLLLLTLVEGDGGEEGQGGREEWALEHGRIVVGRISLAHRLQRIEGHG